MAGQPDPGATAGQGFALLERPPAGNCQSDEVASTRHYLGEEKTLAAIKNPYGVGDSGELLTDCKNRCACCQGWFVFRGHPRMRERWPKRCPQCEGHRLDGSAQDVIVASTEHAERFRDLADRAYAMIAEAKVVASKIDERNKYLNDELREVRDERSSLREQVNELRALHTYGRAGTKCACGRQHCQERQILYGEA